MAQAPNLIESLHNMVDAIAQSFDNLKDENMNADNCQRCYNVCAETIDYLNIIINDQESSVQLKRSAQAHIALLCWYADQFISLSDQVIGGDLSVTNRLIKWQELNNAFANNVQTGCVVNRAHTDLKSFLEDSKNLVINKVESRIQVSGGLKVNTELFCLFKNDKGNESIEEKKSFSTKSCEILPGTSLNEWYVDNVHDKLLKKVQEFNQSGSGWRLVEINNLVVTMSTYRPLQAGQSTFVTLPLDIQQKRAVLNIENFDEYCFLWCVVASLYQPSTGHPERTTSYPHFSQVLKYEGIQFPMALNNIPKFEKLNNLSINVYGIESEFTSEKSKNSKIVPIYLSNNYESEKKIIHLLVIQKNLNLNNIDDNDLENFKPEFHFALIKSLSRLVKSQITKGHSKLFFCDRCLNYFKEQNSYENH